MMAAPRKSAQWSHLVFRGLLMHLLCVSRAAHELMPDTCTERPPLPLANASAQKREVALVSTSELKSLFLSGGPVVALLLQRRCRLSRAFWPLFVTMARRFPHVLFVAVDVEFDWSLTVSLGVGGVPQVRAPSALRGSLTLLRSVGRHDPDLSRNRACARTCAVPPQVIFTRLIQPDGTAFHVRYFPIGLKLDKIEPLLMAWIYDSSGELPTFAPSPTPARVGASARLTTQSHADGRARSAAGLGPPFPEPVAAEGEFAGLSGFPEPSGVHWRLVISIAVVAIWALQVLAKLMAPCAPRAHRALERWCRWVNGLRLPLRRDRLR
jgi:hypothetical protein